MIENGGKKQIMSQKITLVISGQPRELSAGYLKPAALEYWQAWLRYEARLAHNPFVEFAAKVQALPEDLRAVATREFMGRLDFDEIPALVLLNTLRSLPAMQTLCVLVSGEDVITEENYEAAFPLLVPFIQREEILTTSLAEANRLRAEVGKPPLGKPAPDKPVSGRPAAKRPLAAKTAPEKTAPEKTAPEEQTAGELLIDDAELDLFAADPSPQGG